jgi:hypothetical protein
LTFTARRFEDLKIVGQQFIGDRERGVRVKAPCPSTRDLMARMGHDSPQAAMIYQHATSEADRAIANALNTAVQADRKKARKATKKAADKTTKKPRKTDKKRRDDPDDGTAGALAPVG